MLNCSVLVLNRHYQPIHVTNAKRAFPLLYLGVARAIDREFRTFDFESWAPAVRRDWVTTSCTPSTGSSGCRG